MRKFILTSVLLSGLSCQVSAVPFENIRIGDNDGFGFDGSCGFSYTGDGGAADRNNDGHLGAGDVLPSLNGDSVVATGSGDDFDNRNSESISAIGATNLGSTGSEFTDISLSTSYDSSSSASNVYDANNCSNGSGGVFPAGSSSSLPNQPGFIFDFFVATGDIAAGADIFFNMIFGDYDVVPAEVDITFDSSASVLAVNQQNNGPDDGLIQAAFVTLGFYDVFTATAGGWRGYVEVDFDAPNEPYTAFDFVELSTAPLAVPTPGTLVLFTLGLAFFGAHRLKR